MARTIRRQPFSVSTNNSDYPRSYFFNQAQFKGLCDNQNDVSIDPQTFADVKNMYVDENGILTSRPPLKFYDGEAYIIDQWLFGAYGLRLYRVLCHVYEDTDEDGNKANVVEAIDNPQEYPIENLYFVFLLRSITHNTVSGTLDTGTIYGEMQWAIPVETLGWDFIPKVTCAQIEDKIFVWFAGVDFVAFNTKGVLMSNGTRYPYFESAVKYLYYPIHKLVINGIESDLETKNFLTETYKRRYQYSALSSVNFEKLTGRQMSVNMNGDMTQDKSKHLYDITVQEHQDKMMIYPYSPTGGNYHIDIAQTARATVVLRYSIATHIIEISFDGRYFRPVPTIEDIIGLPMLTRDGLWAVAFTRKGLAKCKLVAQDSIDFIEAEDVFDWVVEPYMRNVLINGFPGYLDTLDPSFTPTGYFETIDQFAYVFQGPSVYSDVGGNLPYLYVEWLSGANDAVWGHAALINVNKANNSFVPIILDDDIKVHVRYVAPTIDHQDLGAVVSIMTPNLIGFTDDGTGIEQSASSGIMLSFFKQNEENIGRTLRNNDILHVTEFLGNKRDENADAFTSYVYRLNASGTQPVDDDDNIYANDVLICTPNAPFNISDTADYSATREYKVGDFCANSYDVIFKCIQDCVGKPPQQEPGKGWTYNDYWVPLTDPADSAKVMLRKEKWAWTRREGDTTYTGYFLTDMRFKWLRFTNVRYRLEMVDSSLSTIAPNKRIRLSSLGLDITYTAADLSNIFGKLTLYNDDGSVHSDEDGWSLFFSNGISVPRTSNAKIYTGNAVILGLGNPATMERFRYIGTGITVKYTDEDGNTSDFEPQGYYSPCTQLDVHALAPTIKAESMSYEFVAGYNILGKNAAGKNMIFDCMCKFKYEYIEDKFLTEDEDTVQLVLGNSQWFKIMPNTDTILTDIYLFCDKGLITLPQNGELAPLVDDTERNITNNDNLVLAFEGADEELQLYDGNVHKLTADGVNIASGIIQSGDVISYTRDAVTENDYIVPLAYYQNNAGEIEAISNRFIIEQLALNEAGNLIGITGGEIKSGELIRLRAYGEEITLPIGHPGNPYTNQEFTIEPRVYPEAPEGWKLGDAWPDSFPTYPPIFANADGTIRRWAPGDPLPTGPILLYGVTNIFKRVQPISIDSTGVWYNIDGTLWTSQVSSDAALELDEYVNSTMRNVVDEDGNVVSRVRIVDMNAAVPEAHAVMNEHYFAYVDKGKNLLEVTQAKHDENKLFSDEGTDLFLYMPKRNEQQFANKMTALHPLSDTEMGIFTEKDIWYISTTTLGDGTVAYTKPIKSKIPAGLRDGSDVITALDGQALIFPTPRGLVALAPQDFVATTEKTLTYLSDAIQAKYHDFYNNGVMSAMLIPEEFEYAYKPFIRITTYKYWILMYKYLDREILALDTRNGTWWVWTTPYPIRSIMVGSRLHILQQIDFSPISEEYAVVSPMKEAPLMGVSYIWADLEVDDMSYWDSTVTGAINGLATLVHENDHVGDRRILHQASPTINWYFTSQRLHFDQINNYKAIKGINMSIKGDDTMSAKLSTKVFRNLYHPEQSDVMEIKVNDLRTFVKRLNLMHVIDFQFQIENDVEADTQHQFRLNSLSVKYEVKERVR